MFPTQDIQLIKQWLKPSDANVYYSFLKYNILWTNILKNQNGEDVKIKRKMAYCGETKNGIYEYNQLQLASIPWNDTLIKIKNLLNFKNREFKYNKEVLFNSVLLNLYEDGKSEIRWHQDRETQLGDSPVIACVNLGYTRNFWFMEKDSGERFPYLVDHGDLLIMGKDCQKKYLHAILKEPAVGPRISLTFREVL